MSKRILILNYEFPPLGGGGGVAAKELAQGFIQKGFEIDYLTSAFKDLKKYEKIAGINVYRVRIFGRKELATASFLSMLSYLFFGFWKGLALGRKNKYDFIQTHFVLPTGPLGFTLSKIFKIKNVLIMHGGDIYDPTLKRSPHRHWFYRGIIKFLIEKADYALTESNHNKENIKRYYRPRKEIGLIPHPYKKVNFFLKNRSELGLAEEKKYLISVGRLIERKGYNYLIQALSLLNRPEVELIIIGDGPEKEKLLEIAEDCKIKDKVHIKSGLEDNQKFQYLSCADIYVLSSIHEGFGIVLQEAMQVGLPIVATNYGGQTDLVKENENGFLVPPKSSEKLAEKIKLLLDDDELAGRISETNKKEIEKFSLEKIIEKYLNLTDGK